MTQRWPRDVYAGDALTRADAMRAMPATDADADVLRTRLHYDGYLLLRGLLPEEDVRRARCAVVEVLAREGFLREDATIDRLLCRDPSASPGLLARPDVAALPDVRAVLEHERLYELFDALFGEPCATVQYKWLRAVAHKKFTGVHTDRVYLGKGSHRLLTAWIPIGAVSTPEGSMMVAPGSHRTRQFARLRNSYGATSVGADGVESGWLSRNGDEVARQWSFRWQTADFEPGDVCILHLDMLHLSASNETNLYRLSCDTRWQPASDPVDPRLRLVQRP